VTRIREGFANIPGYTATAQHRTARPIANGIFLTQEGNAFGALQPELVIGEQIVILLQTLREDIGKCLHLVVESERQIGLEATRADIAGHHAHAGNVFKDIQDHLAFAEAVEEDALRTQVERARPQPDEMASNALKLGENDTSIFDLIADLIFDAQQFLNGQGIAQVIAERSQVIHAVGKHQRLVIRLGLGSLFDAGMQKADIRDSLDHRLALDSEDEAQHTMSAWVLWPHIDGHRIRMHTIL